nr:transient receptor potential cation channel subfamily V member 6 [Onthophagus taurus]
MYQEGKGQIINRAEYLRWKFRDHEQVTLPIEASLSPHDPLAKWEDHEACWQMQFRGSLGETLIHVLIICDTKIHTRLARTLIKCFPKLALDIVEGEEYLGASALHLAIAYNNNELVQDLIDAGANVNQRAVGSFFLPRDQQKPKPAKHTDYEGLAYLGEYPLAWAACCANESVYNLLLDVGANPDFQDNFGNMILHMVVVCDKLDMFGYALRHPKLPASNGISNKAGLTPLTLACKLGRAEVFREMLELSAKEFWRYSNITCSAYSLNALDTLLPNGMTNWNSALFIILNGTKQEHLDMLDGGIIQRLLEEKWKTFARNQFLKRLLILMIHLLFLSSAIYLRPDDPDINLLSPPVDPTDYARYICETCTILCVLSYLIFQQGDEIRNQGFLAFLKQQSNSPPKTIFLISNILILACIPCRLSNDRQSEEAILCFALPGSWFLLMFFAGAVRLTGPFVTMIYSMITGDMLTFGIIYTIVLFGFSQSFYFLYKGFPNVKGTLYNSYISTWMALFQITLGNYDYQELSLTTYPGLSKAVFGLFMVFVPILLLNMLIAMMGNTYAHVIEQSEKEWMKQWAKIVITLERAIPQSDAQQYLQEYSISLGPSDDPTTEQRGVMVIKSKSKTRAKQRKGAVANWKRVGKVTINALKKRNMTGEEMRGLMWGRESLNTPIKKKGAQNVNTNQTDHPGAFSGALTAALDVMAFTQDLNLTQSLNEQQQKSLNQQIPKQNQGDVCLNNQINAVISSGVKELSATSIFNPFTPLINDATNEKEIETNQNVVNVEIDPLRELVLCSKSKCEREKLEDLATKAANITNVEEITLKNPVSVKNVAGIFAGTEAFVKKVEATIKQKYSTLEPSDSEGFGEVPLLGRISRTRRAKSASTRNSSSKSKSSDKRLLFHNSESSSSETITNAAVKDEEEKSEDKLDYAEERIKQVKESLKQCECVESLRPYNIDVALGADKLIVALVEDVGNEVKRPGKRHKRKKRPKTAGHGNRVAPTVDVMPRSCESANNKVYSDEPDSPPDPLEPWSTRGIANMNKILAWENEHDSM